MVGSKDGCEGADGGVRIAAAAAVAGLVEERLKWGLGLCIPHLVGLLLSLRCVSLYLCRLMAAACLTLCLVLRCACHL